MKEKYKEFLEDRERVIRSVVEKTLEEVKDDDAVEYRALVGGGDVFAHRIGDNEWEIRALYPGMGLYEKLPHLKQVYEGTVKADNPIDAITEFFMQYLREVHIPYWESWEKYWREHRDRKE